jgi:hypothetical protein
MAPLMAISNPSPIQQNNYSGALAEDYEDPILINDSYADVAQTDYNENYSDQTYPPAE